MRVHLRHKTRACILDGAPPWHGAQGLFRSLLDRFWPGEGLSDHFWPIGSLAASQTISCDLETSQTISSRLEASQAISGNSQTSHTISGHLQASEASQTTSGSKWSGRPEMGLGGPQWARNAVFHGRSIQFRIIVEAEFQVGTLGSCIRL